MPNRKSAYDYDDLITCGHGELFAETHGPRLPLPPMLMFDRITHVSDSDGAHGKGSIEAEFDVKPDLWFFKCHFEGDPVMPGCLGLDALWQLTGFFLGWLGAPGKGRALGVGEVKFSGMVLPAHQLVRYHINLKRVITRRLVMAIGDGEMQVDGETIYTATDLRVGLFQDDGGAAAR